MRERDDGRRPPPPVTVLGGPARDAADRDGLAGDVPGGAGPRSRPGSPVGLLVVLAAVVVVASAVVLSRPDPPAPPEPLDVSLRLAADTLYGSQGGVLVLPVDVVVRGPEVRLGSSVLWAEPVRQDTVLSGRTRFAAERSGRLRVLVQPDCSLLAPSQGHRLVLTLELELVGPEGQRTRQVLDLGSEPAVADRVTALCAPPV